MAANSEILVCHASSCRNAGSEAVFTEIEELAGAFTNCKVRESGCLGYCNTPPAAIVIRKESGAMSARDMARSKKNRNSSRARETPFIRICQLEDSAKIVATATGQTVTSLLDAQSPSMKGRLGEMRKTRARQHATTIYKWNSGLKGFAEQIEQAKYPRKAELELEYAILLGKAGLWTKSLAHLDAVEHKMNFMRGSEKLHEVCNARINLLVHLRREDDIDDLEARIKSGGLPGVLLRLVAKTLTAAKESLAKPPINTVPLFGVTGIDQYSLWNLESVSIVSAHSAVFHLTCNDKKRGTPHPRGGGKTINPVTWHTTLLAPRKGPRSPDVEDVDYLRETMDEEGPLPWIERDYTPISSAQQWEAGACDILIKIYQDGAATSWLKTLVDELQKRGGGSNGDTSSVNAGEAQEQHGGQPPMRLWLSKPLRTLSVPSLRTDETTRRSPASVLLILAGTGVVAIPQILAHRDPYKKLGIATRKTDQMKIPIDLILSCRRDDVLMLPEIIQWSKECAETGSSTTGLRRTTLLLTTEVRTPEVASPKVVPFGTWESSSSGVPSNSSASNKNPGLEPEITTFSSEQQQREAQLENYLESFSALQNCRLREERISLQMVREAVAGMTKPTRYVVSGPLSFNTAVRQYLLECEVDEESITILTA